MQKNDVITIEIQSLGCNGEGVAKSGGYVVFVPFALASEKVTVKILKMQKNIIYAKLLEILVPSPNRVQPLCSVFSKCGGCQLQHLSYNMQLEFKVKTVSDTLKKIAKLDANILPCVASENPYRYRNKLQLPIVCNENKGVCVGFYAINSHRVVETDDCLLQGEWNRQFISIIKTFMSIYNISGYNEDTHEGLIRHIVIRKVEDSYLFTVVINGQTLPYADKLYEMLNQNFCDISFFININRQQSNVILGDKTIALFGSGIVVSNEYGIKSEIGANTFMQVNNFIKKCIYDKIIDQVKILNAPIVIDAYSGAGVLSAMLSKYAKKVYGIEIVDEAVRLANALCKNNKISNVENICGDCAKELPKVIERINGSTVVVLDPPRKGCEVNILDAIKLSCPNKIFYISCNPATLARDLGYLFGNIELTGGNNKNDGFGDKYCIEYIQPYDMFPQTKHVETLVVLKHKSAM